MTDPLISIVLPTRNRAELLWRSIASVLAQTHQNLELIVIDDASSDHTHEVLALIDDPRMRVIRREQNCGAGAARNAGIRVAQGEYIAFQDDDDMWLAHKLETQLDALYRHPDSSWCICFNIRIQKDRAHYIGGERYVSQFDYSRGAGVTIPDWSLIATPGWLVKRSLLAEVGGFDERIRSYDDWELGLRLSLRTKPIFVENALWIQDWWQGSGLTRNERVRADDLRVIMEEHSEVWSRHPKVIARHWRRIGRILSLHDPAPAGRKELWKSLQVSPFHLWTWAALLATYLGQRQNMWLTHALHRIRGILM